MRLREIRDILNGAVSELEIKVNVANSANQTYRLENFKSIQGALQTIERLNLFEKNKELQTLSFHNYSGDAIVVSQAEYKSFHRYVAEIKKLSIAIINAISQTIPSTTENVVNIKIPSPRNFEDLENTFKSLNKIFSQTLYTEELNGSIEIENFDTGSYWIDILVKSKEAIGFLAALSWSAAIIYKKLQEGRIVQQKVREMKITNSALEEIVAKCKQEVNDAAESEAGYLYNAFFKGKDNEQVGRIKMALKDLADLYSKGAEIRPSLEASAEIKNSFPDFTKMNTIESKINKIEN